MSLVRLLSSGKSLIGFKESEIRYRMHAKYLLPKFGSSKNPFIDRPPATAAQSVNQQVKAPPPENGPLSPGEIAASQLKETKPLPALPAAAPGREAGRPARVTPGPGMIAKFARMLGKLNPLARRSRRRPAARTAISMSHRSPVQGELSLDNIKVVRNDLNDADVEIVPARQAERPGRAAGDGVGERAEEAAGRPH